MDHIKRKINKLGFEVDIHIDHDFSGRRTRVPYVVTVTTDKKRNERFLIDLGPGVEAIILDTRPDYSAFLLMVKDRNARTGEANPAKMLLGHDERQLFVAAVPRDTTTVLGAMSALKPSAIVDAESRFSVKRRKLHKRRNKARLRQGDFFFLPVPDLVVPEGLVLKYEPINRGRGASHIVELLYRTGGEQVWVSRQGAEVLSVGEYERRMKADPVAMSRSRWERRVRNPDVYAKGRITHREHPTIVLKTWHRVIPNTEAGVAGFEDMAFID